MDSSTQWNSLSWQKRATKKKQNKFSSQCSRSIDRFFFVISIFFCYLILFINSLFGFSGVFKVQKEVDFCPYFINLCGVSAYYYFYVCVYSYSLCLFGLLYCLTFGCNRTRWENYYFDNTINEMANVFHCMDRINETEMNTNY